MVLRAFYPPKHSRFLGGEPEPAAVGLEPLRLSPPLSVRLLRLLCLLHPPRLPGFLALLLGPDAVPCISTTETPRDETVLLSRLIWNGYYFSRSIIQEASLCIFAPPNDLLLYTHQLTPRGFLRNISSYHCSEAPCYYPALPLHASWSRLTVEAPAPSSLGRICVPFQGATPPPVRTTLRRKERQSLSLRREKASPRGTHRHRPLLSLPLFPPWPCSPPSGAGARNEKSAIRY